MHTEFFMKTSWKTDRNGSILWGIQVVLVGGWNKLLKPLYVQDIYGMMNSATVDVYP
jgi:hypothetical protein